jgi:hypothetical protein
MNYIIYGNCIWICIEYDRNTPIPPIPHPPEYPKCSHTLSQLLTPDTPSQHSPATTSHPPHPCLLAIAISQGLTLSLPSNTCTWGIARWVSAAWGGWAIGETRVLRSPSPPFSKLCLSRLGFAQVAYMECDSSSRPLGLRILRVWYPLRYLYLLLV